MVLLGIDELKKKIAAALKEVGYERTWQQCETKVKNLGKKLNAAIE